MAFVTEEKRYSGKARKSSTPGCLIDVELDEGPFDHSLGDRVSIVRYNDATEALEDMGKSAYEKILRDGESVDVRIPVQFQVWEKE